MPGDDLLDDARRLITERIDSIPELEAVLLLRQFRARGWTPDEAGQRLYLSTLVAVHVLTVLAERGFFVVEGDAYWYSPESAELEQRVDRLADGYAKHLIEVSDFVHAKPSASVRQFAAAFRLRRGG